jgi:hypothetical protein
LLSFFFFYHARKFVCIIKREQRCVCGRVVRARVSLLLADFLSTIKQQTETDREATDCVSNARVRSFLSRRCFFFEALFSCDFFFSFFFELNTRVGALRDLNLAICLSLREWSGE